MSKSAVVGYPSDVTDEEWEFVLPYLLLCREDSPQRKHDLRRVLNGVRERVASGATFRTNTARGGRWIGCMLIGIGLMLFGVSRQHWQEWSGFASLAAGIVLVLSGRITGSHTLQSHSTGCLEGWPPSHMPPYPHMQRVRPGTVHANL